MLEVADEWDISLLSHLCWELLISQYCSGSWQDLESDTKAIDNEQKRWLDTEYLLVSCF